MGIIKDIAKKTMTEEKRKYAKNDFFAFYIGRPLSYILTIPFLKLNIKPNTISKISFIPPIIGFILIAFGTQMYVKIIGWIMFFLWNLLDGVDGNVARYKEISSKLGAILDSTSGYIAMILSYFCMGIGCYYGDFTFLNCDKVLFVILGGLSSIMVIFPRLIMHKRISTMGKDEVSENVRERSSYNILKVIALNLISIAGFVQVLMLIAIIIRCMDLFTIAYFAINFVICIASTYKLLQDTKSD